MTAEITGGNGRPGPVEDEEELGRRVLSSRQSRTAANTGVPFHVFLERSGQREISVDRLTLAALAEATANALRGAAQRNPPRNFYGWAVVAAQRARYAGCAVIASPLPDNRYHADIILPNDATDLADAQREYAIKLAGMSTWRPYVSKPDDESTVAE